MTEWNRIMDEAPEGEQCWIYIPEWSEVHEEVTIAERHGSFFCFGDFEVRIGEIGDEESGDAGVMIGPQAWMPIEKPNAPDWAIQD